MFTQIGQLQQNLSQIAQICNQLSQSEQANVSKLTQMQEAERTAAQQLSHCAQLCQQVSQLVQQAMSSTQFTNVGQPYTTPGAGVFQGTISTGSWANRPINTAQFGPTGQYSGSTPYQS